MNYAKERATHPEGAEFKKFFNRLLFEGTGSCFERDVLRDNKDILWNTWKHNAKASDEGRYQQRGEKP